MWRLRSLFRNWREHLRFRYMPRFAHWLVGVSAHGARAKLPSDQPLAILVDNSVLGNAVTHETAWISTGPEMFAGHEIDTGYVARVPVHSGNTDTELFRSVTYLAGIAQLANEKRLQLYTSVELQAEAERQPMGRFSGYGWFDHNLWKDVRLDPIDTQPRIWTSSSFGGPSLEEQQLQRVNSSSDPLFKALVRRLGEKQSLDAWHIRTAEKHGLYCFLTMDTKLVRSVERWVDYEPFKSLKTRILTPEQFGREFGIRPVHPQVHNYTNASFFVRPDLHMPGERRRVTRR